MEIFEKEESIMRIKSEIPDFNEQEIIEYTKIAIQNVHYGNKIGYFIK